MFTFVLFDPRDPDTTERRRPPRLADIRGEARSTRPLRARRV